MIKKIPKQTNYNNKIIFILVYITFDFSNLVYSKEKTNVYSEINYTRIKRFLKLIMSNTGYVISTKTSFRFSYTSIYRIHFVYARCRP